MAIANQKGTILISMLLLLSVVTILCVVALNMTVVEIQVMGNLKKTSAAMNAAEAAADMSMPLIEATLQAGALSPVTITNCAIDSGPTRTYSLGDEIVGQQNYFTDTNFDADPAKITANLSFSNLGGSRVYVDIDRMYSTPLPGSSLEFASGYEGIGVSAGGGGVAIYYRIDSIAL